MATHVIVNGVTGAISATADFRSYENVSLYCVGLAAADTVTVEEDRNGTWGPVYAYDAPGATNVAVVFTGSGGTPANVSAFNVAGNHFRFTGTSTAPTSITALPRQANVP